jgi:hypothetical protein
LARAFAESRRQGAEAARREATNEVRCWGFAIEDIRFENIFASFESRVAWKIHR